MTLLVSTMMIKSIAKCIVTDQLKKAQVFLSSCFFRHDVAGQIRVLEVTGAEIETVITEGTTVDQRIVAEMAHRESTTMKAGL